LTSAVFVTANSAITEKRRMGNPGAARFTTSSRGAEAPDAASSWCGTTDTAAMDTSP
jgi:hypothetical protein